MITLRAMSRRLGSAFCILGLLLAVVLCNAPASWGHFGEIRAGWRLGVSTVQEGNGGVGASVPNPQFLWMLVGLTPPSVLLGAVVFWADLRKHPFRLHADRWLAGLSPLWLTAVFSFSASTAVRYFLPVSLMLGCVAGAALPGAVRWLAVRLGAPAVFSTHRAGTMLALGFVWLFSVQQVVPLVLGFAEDDRAELTRWTVTHLPPGSTIAQDSLAQLPVPVRQTLPDARLVFLDAPSVADLGSLQEMRARGIGYVVVCWYDSRRYVDLRKHPGPDARDFLRRRQFYEELQTHARSLWRSELRQPFPLRPGLELFALDPP